MQIVNKNYKIANFPLFKPLINKKLIVTEVRKDLYM